MQGRGNECKQAAMRAVCTLRLCLAYEGCSCMQKTHNGLQNSKTCVGTWQNHLQLNECYLTALGFSPQLLAAAGLLCQLIL
jgi:hypothetical protein